MSTFRKHKSIADRSATDRSRHKQKIEKALKEGIRNIVAEESIIGQDGKKKVRILSFRDDENIINANTKNRKIVVKKENKVFKFHPKSLNNLIKAPITKRYPPIRRSIMEVWAVLPSFA